jgi:glutathione-S-conjugate glycine hydrolase
MMQRRSVTLVAMAAVVLHTAACTPAAGPHVEVELPGAGVKFGPDAVRLYDDHAYLRTHDAPDFWALVPYYLPQRDDRACSLACVAMLVNALRAKRTLRADDELATQSAVLQKAGSDVWKRGVGPGGEGVTLDQLGQIITLTLRAYGLSGWRVEVVHMEDAGEGLEGTLARVRRALADNEATGRDIIIANFVQSAFTGDPAGNVGHMAPVAAYDAERRRVLVFDPDRRWYEPYWVPDEVFVSGMATKDETSGKFRGFVWVKPDARP